MQAVRDVLTALPDVSVMMFDRDLRFVFCGGSSLQLAGHDPDAMQGRLLHEVVSEEAAAQLEPMYRQALAGETLEFESHAHGRRYSVRAAPTRDDSGQIVGGSLLSLDITDRSSAEAEVHAGLERLDRIASNVPGVVYQVRIDADGVVSYPYVSDGIRQLAGIAPADLQADPMLLPRMIHPDDIEDFKAGMGGRLIHDAISRWEGRIVRPDGSVRWLSLASRPQPGSSDGSITRDGVAIDVTDERELAEAAQWARHHDGLTLLPNRRAFHEQLVGALADARGAERAVAVCFVDLDRFQQTNNLLGHAAGDEILRTIVSRILGAVRTQDVVARHDSDELTVLVSEVKGSNTASELAHRIEQICREPISFEGRELVVSCSVGVALADDDALDAEHLIHHANTAMYRAKQQGGARVALFSAELERETDARESLGNSLRDAVEQQAFQLVYQPQLDLHGACVAMEALVRWHPDGMLPVPPSEFIPLAEELGLIGAIGAWVLREACASAATWAERGAPVRVCVNLSPHQLADHGLADLVSETLVDTGLSASLLELELTETALMKQGDEGAARLGELRSLGIRISLDDFGTGYSSLARLQHLPLDALKIDRSFVAEIGIGSGTAVARSIIELAHTLGLQVIAEGVETPDQLAVLQSLRCDQMQGYLLGRPLPDSVSIPLGHRGAA